MTTEEFVDLVHLTHKLRHSLKAGSADLMDLNLNQVPFEEVEDFAFVMQMANAMIHSN